MFKNILVPLDGSHTSGLGLDEAIKLAKDHEATLYLLHVVDDHVVLQSGLGSEGGYMMVC
jgi:nucleotide-binding universal stress UspA family protein